jgi:hypothetical protein
LQLTTPDGGSLNPDVSIYSYLPRWETDPLTAGALWSFNYFFFNRTLKKVLFFAVVARRCVRCVCARGVRALRVCGVRACVRACVRVRGMWWRQRLGSPHATRRRVFVPARPSVGYYYLPLSPLPRMHASLSPASTCGDASFRVFVC